jgi:hypothetical protein
LTKSESGVVTSQMTNHMFGKMVYIGLTRVFARRSVRGVHGSARSKSLQRTGLKWKRICQTLNTAGRRGPANASVVMLSTLGTSQWIARQGEMFGIASVKRQQAASYPRDSSRWGQECPVLSSHWNWVTLYRNTVRGVSFPKRLALVAFERHLKQISRWFYQTFHAWYAQILPNTLQYSYILSFRFKTPTIIQLPRNIRWIRW